MNLDRTQELVGRAVAVRACEGIHKVMPSGILRLLEIPASAGLDRGQRIGKRRGPRFSQLISRFDVKRSEHGP